MRRIVGWLGGTVEVEAAGPFPERFLNLCGRQRVPFWGVEWRGGGAVRLTVPRRARRRLDGPAERAGCSLTTLGESGLPVFLGRFRRRYALLAGLALSMLAVMLMTAFVLVVDVEGNDTVPTAEILTVLSRLGVRPGAFGPSLDVDAVEQRALMELEGLSWMSINLHGARAEVLVRERAEPPKMVEEVPYGDIVAEVPGVIERLEVLAGETDRTVGEPVAAGDVLIRGNVLLEGPQYSEHDVGWRQVRARGRVWASTWRELTAEIPLTAAVKSYDGAETTRWSLTVLDRRMDLLEKSWIPYPQYDKIRDTWSLPPVGEWSLPVTLSRIRIRSYRTVPARIDPSAALAMLEERLEAAIRAQLGEEGSIVQTAYTSAAADDMLTVGIRAECREEIGRFVPFEAPEEGDRTNS